MYAILPLLLRAGVHGIEVKVESPVYIREFVKHECNKYGDNALTFNEIISKTLKGLDSWNFHKKDNIDEECCGLGQFSLAARCYKYVKANFDSHHTKVAFWKSQNHWEEMKVVVTEWKKIGALEPMREFLKKDVHTTHPDTDHVAQARYCLKPLETVEPPIVAKD